MVLCCGLRCCTEKCGGHCYHINTSDEYLDYKRVSDLNYRAVHFGLVEGTTAHGLPHFARSRGYCKRIFYFIITLIAIGAWIYHTYAILNEYLQYESAMDINIKHASVLEFPTVTVCNQNAIRKSLFDAPEQSTIKKWTDGTDFDYYDPKAENNPGYALSDEKEQRAKERTKINMEVADIDDSDAVYELGHQLDDFIIKCEFDEYECYNNSYNIIHNWQYGNCFSFNSQGNQLVSTKTGPNNGLKLTFNIEQDEYVGELTTKAGIRVMIHPRTSMPFPETNGFDVAPGLATSVGIRKVDLDWLGGRYGECVSPSEPHDDINVYETSYSWTTYTREACDNTCYQQQLVANCGCADPRYPDTGLAIGSPQTRVASCDYSQETQATCAYTIEDQFKSGVLTCKSCKKSCSEVYFEKTISSAAWPANSYATELSAEISAQSAALKKIADDGTISQNLVHLQVYYEDLNYEEMDEIPAYDDTQFMADFGGAIGLWLGASLITVFEFLEYFLDLCCVSCRRCRCCESSSRGSKRPKSSPIDTKSPQKPTSGEPVMMMYPSPDYNPGYPPVETYPSSMPPKMRPRSNRASRLRPRRAVDPNTLPDLTEDPNHPDRRYSQFPGDYAGSDRSSYDAF